MPKYDTMGIAMHSSEPAEVRRIADAIREWLNERHERGYDFVYAISGLHSAVIVAKRRSHDPQEHGD